MFFQKLKLSKQTKLELKQAKKERERCQKLYSDWKDDEYNCGPLKFVWGKKSNDDLTSIPTNFHTLNDLTISYNRDNKKYLLDIETIYEFNSNQDRIEYLNKSLRLFRNYLKENNLFDCNYDPFFLYRYNDGNLFIAESLTELCYKFSIFVTGYSNL